jgi:hypothetical protein
MAMLPNVFKADNTTSSYEPIPAGWYEAEVAKSEMKDTKSGGKMLSVQFKIIDGDYEKRVVYANFNLVNSNPQAVEIAQRELGNLIHACGLEDIEDSVDLHGIPIAIRVKIQEGTAAYPEPRNAIAAYKPASELN